MTAKTIPTATLVALLAVLCLAVSSGPGWAQPDNKPSGSSDPDSDAVSDPDSDSDGDADRPWAVGVSAERQRRATELLDAGNQLLFEFLFAEALAQYEKAIAEWDHPAIRFNMAVSLYNVGKLVEANAHLERALQYGAAPLEKSVYEQAVRYQRLLEAQLAEIIVVCGEPGVEVALDGKRLFVGPGKARRRVLPGEHQVVGSKAGYLTETRLIKLVPGEPENVSLSLIAIGAATVTRRRWKPWKPWAAVGAGATLGLIGAGLRWRAGENFADYDRELAFACPGPQGCEKDDEDLTAGIDDLRTRAEVQNSLGMGSIIAGSATVAAGLVLVFLNQPRAVPVERADSSPDRRGDESATSNHTSRRIVPIISPSAFGVEISF